ncbi:universal stress protein [Alkalicoccus chagannorensis]|uniref:universal stress protein n=1 Tax=Alkalicoccus chagannorensis TaxID=427072 RepID=UPI0004109576|nr:universal stress protein [Alkalicoccus chagannorensis]
MADYKHILVGLDVLEDGADRVFEHACQAAVENDARLTIAYVMNVPEFTTLERMDPQGAKELKQEARENLQQFHAKAEERGVNNVASIVDKGVPKKRIISHLSKEHNPDLLVIGQTRGSRFYQLLDGNTSNAVKKKANCDVTVVQMNDEPVKA